MRVQMNLEVTDQNRVRAAYNIGKLFGPDVAIETQAVMYLDPDGKMVRTDCCVIDGQLPGETYACGAAYSLALAFEQDCIAVYLPDKRRGMLVGPGASKWPAFDLTFFNRPKTVGDGGLILQTA